MKKYSQQDKWEAYLIKKPKFLQDDAYTSPHLDQFHTQTAWGYNGHIGDRGFRFGVQKGLHLAAGYGIYVDRYFIGKSET